jgi:succinate dehydrogenase / fumarate reductase cytochrome b subunit
MLETVGAFTKNKIRSLAGLFAGIGALIAIHSHSAILLGPDAYDVLAGQSWIVARDQGIWLWIEVIIFGIPMAYYGAMGMLRWWNRAGNLNRFGTFRNWLGTAQGWTGVFLFFFVTFHLWYVWRVFALDWDGAGVGQNPLVGDGPQEMVTAAGYMTAFLAQNVFYVVLYALGIFALAFHLSNGMWNFAVNWGITAGRKSMAVSTVVCAVFFGGVFLLGMNALSAFVALGA